MRETLSLDPLEAVAYYPRGNGIADVYLRKDIGTRIEENDDGSTYTVYFASEIHAVTDKPESWFTENFDAAWSAFELLETPESDRIKNVEDQLTDVQLAMVEFYEAVIG